MCKLLLLLAPGYLAAAHLAVRNSYVFGFRFWAGSFRCAPSKVINPLTEINCFVAMVRAGLPACLHSTPRQPGSLLLMHRISQSISFSSTVETWTTSKCNKSLCRNGKWYMAFLHSHSTPFQNTDWNRFIILQGTHIWKRLRAERES